MRRLAAPVALVGVLLAVPGVASALWAATAGGSAPARAGTLAAPATTTIRWDPTVRVSWTEASGSFAAGYRVSRSVSTSGPWTQFADVPAGTTSVADTPGAGTWHYQVHAYRGAWTSPGGPVVTRADPTYVVTGGTGTGSNCPALTPTYTVRQGFVPSGSGISTVFGGNSARLCTDTYTSGQVMPAGSTTITAYVANTGNKACGITVAASLNATAALGTSVLVSIPAGTTTAAPRTWTLSTPTATFVTGDRINIRFTPDGNCGSTSLAVAGSSTPTRVTFPG